MRKHSFLLLFGLLLATCDGGSVMPVLCGPSEVLATDEKRQLFCRPAPDGMVAASLCTSLLTSLLTSDGRQLSCTSRDTSLDQDAAVRNTLGQIEVDAAELEQQIQTKMPPAPSRYVGVSTLSTNGRIQSGIDVGLGPAAAICAAQFGLGAHMCMMDELYQSVANGTLVPTDVIPLAWVYMPNWSPPLTAAEQPEQGVADNCHGYTYPLGARSWVGVLAEWRPLPDGTVGFRWHSGSDAGCQVAHPIACCN